MSWLTDNDRLEQIFTWIVFGIVAGICYVASWTLHLDFWRVLVIGTLYLAARTTVDSWRHQAESNR